MEEEQRGGIEGRESHPGSCGGGGGGSGGSREVATAVPMRGEGWEEAAPTPSSVRCGNNTGGVVLFSTLNLCYGLESDSFSSPASGGQDCLVSFCHP